MTKIKVISNAWLHGFHRNRCTLIADLAANCHLEHVRGDAPRVSCRLELDDLVGRAKLVKIFLNMINKASGDILYLSLNATIHHRLYQL